VIRAGAPEDSGLIMRRLATIDEVTCASPDYLARHGVPVSPDDLDGHQAVGFVSSRSGEVIPLEFTVGGKLKHVRLPSRVTVNNSDTMADLARLGLGIVQAPRYRFTEDFAGGRLVEILADTPPSPTPLTALYPQSRQLTPRLRVFLDWAAAAFADPRNSQRAVALI
jgi:DNA-binding transcriptional LysR family regulator